LIDYGKNYEIVKLALRSRMELEYEDEISKDEVIVKLTEEAINRTCSEIYNMIPRDEFKGLMKDLAELCFEPIDVERVEGLEDYEHLYRTLLLFAKSRDELNSALEILLEAIKRCTGLIEKVGFGRYVYAGYEA
jgi:magnesium chelatase subunit I